MDNFVVFGEENPILHFSHANGFSPKTYTSFFEALTEKYQVWALPQLMYRHPDLNPWDTDTNWWMACAEDLIEQLDKAGASNIVGCGHSLGGVVTFYAALLRPDLFEQLVLFEPVLFPQSLLDKVEGVSLTERKKSFPMVSRTFVRRKQWVSYQDAWDRFRPKKPFAKLSDDALWAYVHHNLIPNEEGVTLACTPAWESWFYATPPTDLWEKLTQIKVPVTIVRGSETDTLYAEVWERLGREFPTIRRIELERFGHLLPLEEPEQVAQLLL